MMPPRKQRSTATVLGRAVLAGLAGTVVMTAFQKLIEMPLTKRKDSYAPADFAEKVLPVHPTTPAGRRRLNYTTHFALGGMWGTAYGIAVSRPMPEGTPGDDANPLPDRGHGETPLLGLHRVSSGGSGGHHAATGTCRSRSVEISSCRPSEDWLGSR
jgi:hypothetical protein